MKLFKKPESIFSNLQSIELQQHPRNLGLAVLRGPTITLVAPADGFEEIDDPFAEG